MNISDIFGGNDALVKMILALIGGNYVDQKNTQSGITAIDAIKGSEEKGITGSQSRYNSIQQMIKNAQSGVTGNTMLDQARQTMQSRVNTGVNPPARTITPANVQVKPDTQLMARAKGLTMNTGNQNQLQQLLNIMNQRFTPRPL